jgi:DNA-binding response OmpR family regulator
LCSGLDYDRALEGKRVIIFEDEPLLALEAESILTTAGCEVLGVAGTLERARLLISGAESDAALVDVNLCGQRVDELAVALTQKNIPFAFVTGYGRESLPPGFRDAILLKKPFSCEQVLDVLKILFYQTEPHSTAAIVQLRPKRPLSQ